MKEGGWFSRLFGRKRETERKETPAPVVAEPVPAPVVAEPVPAPVVAEPVPAPAVAEPVPAPVVAEPAPAEPAPAGEKRQFVVSPYDRSFLARIIQADDVAKSYYAGLKRELLSYGLRSRIGWKQESFRYKRRPVAKMKMRGKTLCVYFALSPAAYEGTKYKVEDVSAVGSHAETPCLYRISNGRRYKYAAQLAAAAVAPYGLVKKETEEIAPHAYESTEILLARGLIRERGKKGSAPLAHAMESVKAAEVDAVLQDEVAAALVEQSVRYADRTKQGIINVDTLGQYFGRGETVTLDEIRKRVPGYAKVTYIKVLARGTLSEPLTVEADEFSIEAVKMILLTGGRALRTRRTR